MLKPIYLYIVYLLTEQLVQYRLDYSLLVANQVLNILGPNSWLNQPNDITLCH